MPYTLMKGLVWVLLAVLLGIVIGWLLRSVAAKRQVERARAANLGTADREELERLRQRVADLEPVVDDRDRSRPELDGAQGAPPIVTTSVQPLVTTLAVVAPTPGSEAPPEPIPEPIDDTLAFDHAAAAAAIGRRVVHDDLTVVEGIGPKIAELCHGIGITTWSELAETEVSLLRTMLNDAGQRFKAHDPSSWPQQAALLAVGAWHEFAALSERVDGGRPAG
jgi:predicted flap endonuclease-1-like 5' DNA nuclease